MFRSKWWACVLLVGCVETVETDPAGPEDDVEVETEWEVDDEGGCPDSWVLTYAIEGRVDITDGISLLGFLFLGQEGPPAPFPACGIDPETSDCSGYPPCG